MITCIALILDYFLGEPKTHHPLIGFGKLAGLLEATCNKTRHNTTYRFMIGVVCWCLLVLPLSALTYFIVHALGSLAYLFEIAIVYFCIAHRALIQHIQSVLDALHSEDLPAVRAEVARIVSRDTSSLEKSRLCQATLESALENGADACYSALFWFAVLGAPGIVAFRLANTLDAMWGYRNARYDAFGKFSARMDDILNYIPARLVALSYCVLGNSGQAIRAWREQARACASPNGGPVMCAGAGALNVTLGGPAWYHGQRVNKTEMGFGPLPDDKDIRRGIRLLNQTTVMWACACLMMWCLGLPT